ncbi:MAG: hypothetical protein R3C05_28125 [Pirellulaceae bacterium]
MMPEVRLPETTVQRLLTYRSQVRKIKVIEGLLAAFVGLGLSYLAVFAIDRVVDTPAIVRGGLLLLGAIGLGVLFPMKCHRWIWGTRQMTQVAKLIQRRHPVLGDQLLGVIELSQSQQTLGKSATLTIAAIKQVDRDVTKHDLASAVPASSRRRWAIVAGVPTVLIVLASLLVPPASRNAALRWLMPWADVPRYTFAQVEPLPERIVVPHGEAFKVEAKLDQATAWSPDSGRVFIADQPVVDASLQDHRYTFDLPPQTETGSLNLRIGDVRESVAIEPATRPELTALRASITLPPYLQYDGAQQQDVRSGTISLVKGSRVSFTAEVSRGLQSAHAGSQPLPVSGNTIAIDPFDVREPNLLELRWIDELGLSAKDAFRLRVEAVEDRPPVVACRPTTLEQVILSTDVITFELSAEDDYGVRQVGLQWSGIADPIRNPNPQQGEKVVVNGSPEQRSIQVSTAFGADSDSIRPQSLEVRAFALDYRPEAERAYSVAYVLHILSPEDHAIWVAQQLRRWASKAEDVYEEEMRLHDVNRELRRMDISELEQRETRQRIEQQAAAELANADRLSMVSEEGKQLIEQALKNRQMLASHLETLAESIQRLDDIAEQRMPSVADLLKQATLKPSSARPSEKKSPGAPQVGKNQSTAQGKPSSENESKSPKTAVPKIADVESGFNKPNPDQPKTSKPGQPGKPKLSLPTTVLNGGPPSSDKPTEKPKDDAATPSPVDDAVEEQADLLAEFEKVREDLQNILDDLENSTFVKRFKAASRRQLEVAADLNRSLLKGFGVELSELNDRQHERSDQIAQREQSHSQFVWTIQSDLEAYAGRKQDPKLVRILEEMQQTEVVNKLQAIGDRVTQNLQGESISRAEYWADALDRWGEEMVSPSKCKSCNQCKGESLPPAIILEVMRILEAEMDLRDQTRTLEQAKQASPPDEYHQRAKRQYETQDDNYHRTLGVMIDIRALPEGNQKFGKELRLLTAAAEAMHDAAELLQKPDTGPPTIAAETEAIELLLQSKRVNPKAGGGGGGSSPGGGGSGDTDQAAIALHGPGADRLGKVKQRVGKQTTGSTGSELPAEFRDGLDAFFNAIESER